MLWFTAELTATAAADDWPPNTSDRRSLVAEGALEVEEDPPRRDAKVAASAWADTELVGALEMEADVEAAPELSEVLGFILMPGSERLS
jgi:hypothetical protein